MDKKTDIHHMVGLVESSPIFSSFKSINPHHYLAHAFATIKGLDSLSPLEFGYYSKEDDKITVFKTEPIAAMPPEEVFKEEGVVQKLDLDEITVGFGDVAGIVKNLYSKSYSHHPVLQMFCVLQYNTAYETPVWNITVVFSTLHMLNVKVDAVSGRIIVEDLQNIMSLKSNQ